VKKKRQDGAALQKKSVIDRRIVMNAGRARIRVIVFVVRVEAD
jgi:hypothetical protein